ncbi:hypothetical protein Tco_0784828, partial [Tanacetum coccineum]
MKTLLLDQTEGTKSQSNSFGNSVQAEEPEFKVLDSDMPYNQEGNLAAADKSSKTFDELMSTPIDFYVYIMNGLNITNLTQETLLGPAVKLLKGTHTNFAELEYDFKESYKTLLEKLDWDNPEVGDYPFDLTKPLPLVMNGNHQIVPVDYFFNNNLKKQRKTFYAYARGLESSHDVYSTKCILEVTRVEVMQKHRYGYLREIEVRRADNDLYTFKEGDFPRLRINDIKDMLIFLVQNRLTNLSGDDVSDFAIAFYQKKITVTKPETTRPGIRKRNPYTSYTDPQGFIYVDNQGRNRLMHSDELYKFSDGTLTSLRTSLDDITKNIQMEYLPQRRWSSLEKIRAHIMIKAIDKQLKER